MNSLKVHGTADEPDSPPGGSITGIPRLLWGWEEIEAATGICRRTLQRQRAAGLFPEPSRTVGRRPFWTPERVRQWSAGEKVR